eukprot:4783318-Pyramimonas_sp.AAC.1
MPQIPYWAGSTCALAPKLPLDLLASLANGPAHDLMFCVSVSLSAGWEILVSLVIAGALPGAL